MSDLSDRLNAALRDRYAVEHEIGAGGMATVFLARDLRLDRTVALKVLRPELSAAIGPRFLQEIRVTANLQHPHLLGLIDSGQADSLFYYAMPYVEGESLRRRLDREGPLPLEEAVRIARETAGALDYAHRRGVIHRDIKPENILLQDGQVLVADFGIALAVSTAGGSRLTDTGLTLGTPSYMSPEQASAEKRLDARSDIYALGCVCYEMLTGEPPFTGPTSQAIFAKAMTERPTPPSVVRSTVPGAIDAAVLRALAFLPADRFATATEFGEALRIGLTPSGPQPAVRPRGTRTRRVLAVVPWAVAALAVLALTVTSLRHGTGPSADGWVEAVRMTLPATPADSVITATGPVVVNATPEGAAMAVSPDGQLVVYAAARAGDSVRLYLRRLSEWDARPLPGTGGASMPFFSPDGQWVGFFGQEQLQKVPVAGGTPQVVVEAPRAVGASWGPDGKIVYALLLPDVGIYEVADVGGAPRRLHDVEGYTRVDPEQSVALPDVVPDTEWILYTAFSTPENARVVALSRKTGKTHVVQRAAYGGLFVPPGLMVYAWHGQLLAARFDPDRAVLTGPAVPVQDSVLTSPLGVAQFDIATNGTLAYLAGPASHFDQQLVWVAPEGTESPLPLPRSDESLGSPRIAPDGHRLIYSRAAERAELVVADLARGTTRRFTDDSTDAYWGAWTPDGQRIVFQSNRDTGRWLDLWVQPVDWSAAPVRLAEAEAHLQPQAVTPDGVTLLYTIIRGAEEGVLDLRTLRLDSNPDPRDLIATRASESHAAVSPDGRWLAYSSDESGRWEVYVRRFPLEGGITQVSTDGGIAPVWSPDGRQLYFRSISGRRMYTAAVRLEGRAEAARPRLLFEGDYAPDRAWGRAWDLSPDGRRFLLVKLGTLPPAPRQLQVILGWRHELDRWLGQAVK